MRTNQEQDTLTVIKPPPTTERRDYEGLKDRVSCRDFFQHATGLTPKKTRRRSRFGDEDIYLSPDRAERTPSFFVNSAFFKDFGGNAKGDVFDIAIHFMGARNRAEAYDMVAAFAGDLTATTPVPRRTPPPQQTPAADLPPKEWQRYHIIALQAFKTNLQHSPEIRAVLHQWGYTDDIIAASGVGYNPKGIQTPFGWIPSGITYPIQGIDGQLMAVKIRCPYEKDSKPDILAQAMDCQPAKAKYMSASGSKPSQGFYRNLDTPGAVVIITEGEKDADNVAGRLTMPANVASFGSAGTIPTQDILQSEVFQQAPCVVIMADHDPAGLKGAATVKEAIEMAVSCPVIVATVPEGKDATDFVTGGGDIESYIKRIVRNIPRRVNARYISDAMPDRLPKFTVLQSPTGTGKTHWAAATLTEERTVILGHRVALVRQQARRFDAFCYLDTDQLPDDTNLCDLNRVAVTINSLHKLRLSNGAIMPGGTLIIDESEQLIKQILSPELFKAYESDRAMNVLIAMMRTADRVIFMDAHAGAATQFILSLAMTDDDELLHVINDYQNPDRAPVTIQNNKGQALERIWADVKAGKTVAIPTDSKAFAKDFAQQLTDEGYHVLVLHSDNADEAKNQVILADPDSHLHGIDAFIYSPSIGSGVDIQTLFDAMHVMLLGGQLIASDGVQLLRRVRNVREHIYMYHRSDPDPNSHKPDTPDEVKDFQLSMYKSAYVDGRLSATYDATGQPLSIEHSLTPSQQNHLNLWCIATAADNKQHNKPIQHYRKLLQFEGHSVTVRENDGTTDRQKTLNKALKAVRLEREERERELVLSADPISEDTLDAIKDAGDYLESEHLPGHIRWKIEHHYGQPITPGIYDDYQDYAGSLSRVIDLMTDEETLKEKQQQQFDEGMQLDRMTYHYTRQRATRAILARVYGLDSEHELTPDFVRERWLSAADLEHFAAYCRANAKKIHRLFGFNPAKIDKAQNILRRFLRVLGLTVDDKRSRANGRQVRYYRINPDSVATRYSYATAAADSRAIDLSVEHIVIPEKSFRAVWKTSKKQNTTKPYSDAGKPRAENHYNYNIVGSFGTPSQPTIREVYLV